MSVFTNPASGAAADGLSETQGLEENRTMIRMFLVAAGSAAFLGCSATDSTGPKDDGLVTVFGVVTHIEDKVPVDGSGPGGLRDTVLRFPLHLPASR
jgi:hypothetical protein